MPPGHIPNVATLGSIKQVIKKWTIDKGKLLADESTPHSHLFRQQTLLVNVMEMLGNVPV